MSNPLRVAAFQRQPLFDEAAATLERICADLEWCDKSQVQLAVFPECYLQGYATDRATIARRAMTLCGAPFEPLLARLTRFRADAVIGMIERREAACLNSAVVIRHGQILGAYAKTHPNEPGFEAGTEYPTFKVSDWVFGINICNDANYPEAARRISKLGTALICLPLNNMLPADIALKWRTRSVENLQQRARETGCWVVSSDVVGRHGDNISHGCTCIVRPDGSMAARAAEGCEGVVVFDLHD